MEKLDLSKIESELSTLVIGRPLNYRNELWDTIDSTNTRAKELAGGGAPLGAIVFARQQTAGRGRLGRSWVSPPDAGIYMSVILRSSGKSVYEMPLLTMAAGVAVAAAIESAAGVTVGLKWVNDLVCDGCKVGGILAESAGNSAAPYVVLGMGINTNLDPTSLPDDLKSKVTSLHLHAKHPLDANKIACEIASQLETMWNLLESGNSEEILTLWKQRSVTLGQRVKAILVDKTIDGVAADVTERGALRVITDDGQTLELTAGEVQIRRADGAYC